MLTSTTKGKDKLKEPWESLRSCLNMAQFHCGLSSFLQAGLGLSKLGLVFVAHPLPDDSSPSICTLWWWVQAGTWMLANFRSSVEILFLRWKNLRLKLVFSKSKDIFQCRVEANFSHETSIGDESWWREPGCTSDSSEVAVRSSWPPHEQGPPALHNNKGCVSSMYWYLHFYRQYNTFSAWGWNLCMEIFVSWAATALQFQEHIWVWKTTLLEKTKGLAITGLGTDLA